jgi:hypothetical protein
MSVNFFVANAFVIRDAEFDHLANVDFQALGSFHLLQAHSRHVQKRNVIQSTALMVRLSLWAAIGRSVHLELQWCLVYTSFFKPSVSYTLNFSCWLVQRRCFYCTPSFFSLADKCWSYVPGIPRRERHVELLWKTLFILLLSWTDMHGHWLRCRFDSTVGLRLQMKVCVRPRDWRHSRITHLLRRSIPLNRIERLNITLS